MDRLIFLALFALLVPGRRLYPNPYGTFWGEFSSIFIMGWLTMDPSNPTGRNVASPVVPGKVQGTLPQQLEKVGPWDLGPDRTDFAKSLAKLIGSAQNRLRPD